MNKVTKLLTRLSLVAAMMVAVCATVRSQPAAGAGPADQKSSQPASVAGSTSDSKQVVSQAVARPGYLTPIAGYQGVLAETLDGATVAAQAAEEKFNPASSVKLATTLVALQTLGPDHKFVTGVWAAGPIDKSTGTLTGDLVVTGRDPSFHYEHAVMLARQLNDLGIRTVTGKVIVTPGFTMNFDWSARHSGEMFRDTLDAAKRSASATRAWIDERTLVGDNNSLSSVPSVVVSGEIQIGTAPPGAVPILTHKSSKLVDVLKALLCFSNTFMAERIGESLGGPQTIRATLNSKLQINPDEIAMSSTSGLGINRF